MIARGTSGLLCADPDTRAQYAMKLHSDVDLDKWLPDTNACKAGGGAD